MQMLPGLHTSYTTITRPLAECAIKVCASNQVECVMHASNQGATFQTKKTKAVKAQNPEVLQHHQHPFSGTPIPAPLGVVASGSMKIPWSPAGSWTHTEENRENRLLPVKRGAPHGFGWSNLAEMVTFQWGSPTTVRGTTIFSPAFWEFLSYLKSPLSYDRALLVCIDIFHCKIFIFSVPPPCRPVASSPVQIMLTQPTAVRYILSTTFIFFLYYFWETSVDPFDWKIPSPNVLSSLLVAINILPHHVSTLAFSSSLTDLLTVPVQSHCYLLFSFPLVTCLLSSGIETTPTFCMAPAQGLVSPWSSTTNPSVDTVPSFLTS